MTRCSARPVVAFWLRAAGSLLLMTTLAAAEPRQFVAKTNLTLITAGPARGHAGEAIPLNIRAPKTVNGEETALLLRYVPEHAGAYPGVNVGSGGWLLPASQARQLTLTAWQQGAFLIEVQLLTGHLKSIGAPNRFIVTVTGEDAEANTNATPSE